LLWQLKPNVVFVGTPKAGLLGTLAAVITRVPYRIYVLRGLRLETANGAMRRLLIAMERLTARGAHTVFAVSPSLRRRALQLSIGRPDKVQVLGRGSSNGVDDERFRPDRFTSEQVQGLAAQVGLRPNVPVVGYVGRLTVDKGLTDLAAAHRLLISQNVEFQMLVIGAVEGSAETLDQFRDQNRALIETGPVEDTSPYYPLMDVLVLPTLREGFPNVVLEASASGVPVITTDATGAIDSVIHGCTGYITPIGQPDALAAALASALANPAERQRLGTQGRAFVVSNFGQTQFWPRLDLLLERGNQ
jgi:glycosyltransferase involved in cell wall biosynthesis